jgi:hypothetical protein
MNTTAPHQTRPAGAGPEYQVVAEWRPSQSVPALQETQKRPRISLERFLGYFADVRSGEVWSTLLLTATVFLLLFAYYLLKTVREALILTEGGAYVKAYSSAGQAALLMILVPLYGFVGAKVVRIKLLGGLLLFFIANLVAFYGFGVNGAREGVVFYIWVGIFNVFIISQVWAFANDIYTEEQGKRLFPMIGIGSSAGAWLGARGAERLVSALQATPYQLQLLAAAILRAVGMLLVIVNRIASRHPVAAVVDRGQQKLGCGRRVRHGVPRPVSYLDCGPDGAIKPGQLHWRVSVWVTSYPARRRRCTPGMPQLKNSTSEASMAASLRTSICSAFCCRRSRFRELCPAPGFGEPYIFCLPSRC